MNKLLNSSKYLIVSFWLIVFSLYVGYGAPFAVDAFHSFSKDEKTEIISRVNVLDSRLDSLESTMAAGGAVVEEFRREQAKSAIIYDKVIRLETINSLTGGGVGALLLKELIFAIINLRRKKEEGERENA